MTGTDAPTLRCEKQRAGRLCKILAMPVWLRAGDFGRAPDAALVGAVAPLAANAVIHKQVIIAVVA